MTRDEIEALLPFYVNGTLEGDEAAAVDEALALDRELRDEMESLAAIRDTMREDTGYSPGEVGLARLMREIEAEAKVEAPPPVEDEPAPPVVEDPVPLPAEPGAPLIRPWVWRIAAALLLAVALAQGALLIMRWGEPGYHLAGAAEADFTIAFAPEVTEPELRLLLLEAGVEIVGGPSALGLYSLAVLDGVGQDEAYDVLAGSDLVESVSRDTP